MKSFIKCGAIFITTSTVLFLGHNFDYYYCNNNNNNNNNNNRSYNSPPPRLAIIPFNQWFKLTVCSTFLFTREDFQYRFSFLQRIYWMLAWCYLQTPFSRSSLVIIPVAPVTIVTAKHFTFHTLWSYMLRFVCIWVF